MRRRALLAAAGASLLTACANGASPSSPGGPTSGTPVTVGLTYVPNVQFCAFYLGLKKGLFADQGLAVTLRHHGEQEDVFGAVLGGQEDIVFASADEAMVVAAEGKQLRTFATSYQKYPLEVLGLGEGETSLAALKGARLGIPGHYGSSYYAARAAIHEAGLQEAEVNLADIGYTQISALRSGQVDYIMGFSNNETVQLQRQGQKTRSIPVFTEPKLVGPSLITAGKASDETLGKFAAALKASEEAVIADPDAALDATAEQVPAMAEKSQREAAAAVLDATTKLWRVDGEVSVAVDPAAFERMGAFLVDAGLIDAAPATPYVKVN